MGGLWDTVSLMKLHSKFYEYLLLYVFLDRTFMTYIILKRVFVWGCFFVFFAGENVFTFSFCSYLFIYYFTFKVVVIGL